LYGKETLFARTKARWRRKRRFLFYNKIFPVAFWDNKAFTPALAILFNFRIIGKKFIHRKGFQNEQFRIF